MITSGLSVLDASLLRCILRPAQRPELSDDYYFAPPVLFRAAPDLSQVT